MANTKSSAKGKGRAPRRAKPELPEISVHLIKANGFRVIHADGVWGGISPNANIHMSLYSERRPLPREVTYTFTDDGKLEETGRDTRSGVVREIEMDAVMSLDTAVSIRDWLNEKIEELHAMIVEAEAQQQSGAEK